ncbi:hypothetical protein LEP1GSC052_1454 [Leptospira kmetyi serovar Malaysia str. Bejo-Iso9]|nr:hypothetical protein LEP1GSC052_1454 [Leptospira kmetyi serovar Malaysia str. Bejo-Iso9]
MSLSDRPQDNETNSTAKLTNKEGRILLLKKKVIKRKETISFETKDSF